MTNVSNFPSKNVKKAIFWSWLLVGTLDICSATIHYMAAGGTNPVNILVYISSGLYGQEAFQIGAPSMAILGIALHYFIAFCWTVIFFTIYLHLPSGLTDKRVLTGVLYGIVIWTIMSQVVVKLSNTPKGPFKIWNALIGAGILCVAIGIPLSFRAYRFYRKK